MPDFREGSPRARVHMPSSSHSCPLPLISPFTRYLCVFVDMCVYVHISGLP